MEDICKCHRCPCCGKLVQPALVPMPYTLPVPAPLPWDMTPFPMQPYVPPIWIQPIWRVDFETLPVVTY